MQFFKALFSIYGFVVFILVMLLIFPFVIFASFFGKVKGGNMIYAICRFWADTCFIFWGIRHTNINKHLTNKGHAVIYVFNHSSYIDIPIMMKTFRNENIRVLAKAELAKVPIFGFIYRSAAVMVDRSSKEARFKSVQELKKILAKNISIVLSPEGTFNTTSKPLKEFYDGAFKIAVETNTPIQPVLFLDALDRLHHRSLLSFNPGKSRAVFLPEILPGTNADLLKQQVYQTMEKELIQHKVSWIKP
jgi:1-acyl-sn-glycerol-3-phosphate acyltransferase